MCWKQMSALHLGEIGSGRHVSVLHYVILRNVLLNEEVGSGGTPRAKEHMKKPDLDITEFLRVFQMFATSDPTLLLHAARSR